MTDAIDQLWIAGLLVAVIAARGLATLDGRPGEETLLLIAMTGGTLSALAASVLRRRASGGTALRVFRERRRTRSAEPT